jgi:putative DNA primase/helicase
MNLSARIFLMKTIGYFVQKAMLEHSLNPPNCIIADGEFHRFKNDKGKDDCWYVAHTDGIPRAAFGDFSTGLKTKCRDDNYYLKLTKAERRDQRIELQQNIRQNEQDKLVETNKAITKATWIWGKSLPVNHHAYLVKKKINPHSARLYNGSLVIPIWSKNTLVSLQFIDASGKKIFLKDGKLKGSYAQVGKFNPNQPAVIAEGWATCVSLHEKFGYPTYVALSASNLRHVAQYVRSIHTTNQIIIFGDNDPVGRKSAQEAADLIGASCLIPPTEGFDWNDQINYENEIGAGL